MAEATFQPAAPVGSSVDAAISGIDAGNSLMARASQARQQLQMEQMRQQEIEQAKVLAPVIRAKATADLISANASIANNQRMEQLRGQAAAVSKPANDEFLDVMQLADFNAKATALASLQAKYQWMSLVPEYKGFVDVINEERIKAHGSAVADANMERQLQESQTNFDRAVTVAEIGAGARQAVAETQAGSREATAQIAADSRAKTEANRAANYDKNRATRIQIAKIKGLQQSAIEADKAAAKAAAAGDAGNAQAYRAQALEYRKEAEDAMAQSQEPEPFTIPNVDGAPQSSGGPKLYTPRSAPGESPSFSSSVRTPQDVIGAMQQMVNDGVISPEQARETLQKLGFKKKGG